MKEGEGPLKEHPNKTLYEFGQWRIEWLWNTPNFDFFLRYGMITSIPYQIRLKHQAIGETDVEYCKPTHSS